MFGSESYLDLLVSTPHWLFEITVEIATSLIVAYPVKIAFNRYVQRHDEKHHKGHISND
jgi:hypothetical protein